MVCVVIFQITKMQLSVKIITLLALCIRSAIGSSPRGETPPNDVFSSIAKMEALFHQETAIVNLLDRYLKDAKNRITIIEK